MNDETVTPVDRITLPWAKEVEVQDIGYDSGLHMLRLRFREGRHRFTTIDLDAATAGQLAKLLAEWAERAGG